MNDAGHSTCLVVGGGITGAGGRPRSERARRRNAAGRARRFRQRHLVVVVEADPRRPALPEVGPMEDDAGIGARARAPARRAPGLVEPQRAFSCRLRRQRPGRRLASAWLDRRPDGRHARARPHHAPPKRCRLEPHIASDGLLGASSYLDAKTDDARLVLRVLQEAERPRRPRRQPRRGASLLRADDGRDGQPARRRRPHRRRGATGEVRARCVVNATGAWADGLRADLGAAPMLRPLRGSHLLFPLWRLPVAQAVSLMHPRDGRPVFAFPWEGVTLVGTTDVDHADGLDARARDHAGRSALPDRSAGATRSRVRASSRRRRDQQLRRRAPGGRRRRRRSVARRRASTSCATSTACVTVTGGKLTTFRVIALDALRQAAPRCRAGAALRAATGGRASIFAPVAASPALARLPRRSAAAPARPVRSACRRARRRLDARRSAAGARHAHALGRAALVDAARAGAPPRRPAAAPHPPRPGRCATARNALLPRLQRRVRGAVVVARRLARGVRALLRASSRTRYSVPLPADNAAGERPTICCSRSTAARRACAPCCSMPTAPSSPSRSSGSTTTWCRHRAGWSTTSTASGTPPPLPASSSGARTRRCAAPSAASP